MYKYSTGFLLKTCKTRNEPCTRENMCFVLYNCFLVGRTWNRSKVTVIGMTYTAIFMSFFLSPSTAVGRELGLASGICACVHVHVKGETNAKRMELTATHAIPLSVSIVVWFCRRRIVQPVTLPLPSSPRFRPSFVRTAAHQEGVVTECRHGGTHQQTFGRVPPPLPADGSGVWWASLKIQYASPDVGEPDTTLILCTHRV